MNAYTNQYQQNHIATASREQILLMLYDGAIRFAKQAKQGIIDKDMDIKGRYISKTIAIISEFSTSLDHEVGGKIAADLDALYNYIINELSLANLKNTTEPLDIVVEMLQDLRNTWAEAIEINTMENQGTGNGPHREATA
jgi:flagellar protein FliS